MELTLSERYFTITVRKKRSRRRTPTDRTLLRQPSAAHGDAKGHYLLASGSRHLMPMR